MTGLLFALMVAASPAQAFDARMVASSAAAERLQGPLDGTWRLTTARGRLLYVIQIADPPGRVGGLQAAWRAPAVSGPAGVGPVETIADTAGRLRLEFADESALLQRDPRGGWRGRTTRAGHVRVVRLVRR